MSRMNRTVFTNGSKRHDMLRPRIYTTRCHLPLATLDPLRLPCRREKLLHCRSHPGSTANRAQRPQFQLTSLSPRSKKIEAFRFVIVSYSTDEQRCCSMFLPLSRAIRCIILCNFDNRRSPILLSQIECNI